MSTCEVVMNSIPMIGCFSQPSITPGRNIPHSLISTKSPVKSPVGSPILGTENSGGSGLPISFSTLSICVSLYCLLPHLPTQCPFPSPL
ncbi:hypothetical protein BDV59DRAFT_57689 [Aspergillus ambiguus]|uniref:uncharacterized protein n=1 Tax=Aspergillus ambiguus TaxID=176160 RepID=UPI003CCDD35B